MKYERKMVKIEGVDELEEVIADSNGAEWYSTWRLVQVLHWYGATYYAIFEREKP